MSEDASEDGMVLGGGPAARLVLQRKRQVLSRPHTDELGGRFNPNVSFLTRRDGANIAQRESRSVRPTM